MTVLIWVLGGYLALIAALYAMQRGLMYHPGHALPSPGATLVAEMAPVTTLTDDGLKLTSWYMPPKDEKPVIVYFQGNAGTLADRDFKVAPWIKSGFGVWLTGYRGFGGNPGNPTEPGLYADAAAALDYLAGQGLGPERIVLYGESLGGGVATETAAALARSGTPVKALILEAPFSSMGAAAQGHYPFVPAKLLVKDRFDNAAKIASISTPLLILHGDRDRVVPQSHGRALYEAAQQPKHALWVAGGAHNNLHNFGAGEKVMGFLKTLR